ncbi:MAG: TPM domain-containing protein [Tunicatimonas sp.]
MATPLFTSEELTQIQQAVQRAEAGSGGEIVPVLARQSSFYESAYWRGGFLLALLVGGLLTLLYFTTDFLLFAPPHLWLLAVLASGLLGALITLLIPVVKRLLIGRATQEDRVLDQAKTLFYDHGLATTEQRTGILLYISFFEHRAVILADVGIDELVPPQSWQVMIDELTTGLKQGRRVESICATLAACGRLLEESGVQRATDDDNELSDEVQVRE